MYETWCMVMFMAFTGAAICYIAVQMFRAAKMIWTLARWLWTERQLDRKIAGVRRPQNRGFVLCPTCYAESVYDPMRGWYVCEHHGVVAQVEDIHHAHMN